MQLRSDMDFFQVESQYFIVIMIVQTQAAFLLNCWVGPVLISRRSNQWRASAFSEPSLQPRPIMFLENSPCSACCFLPSLGFRACSCLACSPDWRHNGWIWSHLWMVVPIVLCSAIWILMLSLISLAVSAWVKLRIVATGVIFITFFIPAGLGEMFNAIMGTYWGALLNFSYMFRLILERGIS